MQKSLSVAFLFCVIIGSSCGVSREIKEAKALGDCRYNITSADSVYISGYDIRQFRDIRKIEDFNPLKFPRIAAGLISQSIPLDARINLSITNPTAKNAAINSLEYKILLKDNELANGTINQRIAVAPNGGTATVPVRIVTNAYKLFSDAKTRDAFAELVRSLSGAKDAPATVVTIKIKPVVAGMNYPGYITIDKEITNKILTGQ
jgi:hypothetical protein